MLVGPLIDPAFMLLVLPLGLLVSLLALRIRCPNCRARLVWQGYFMLQYLPKRCRHCGQDLAQKIPGKGGRH